MLLETLIGMSIFAVAATAIVVSLNKTAILSQTVAEEQRITDLSQNLLKQVLHSFSEGTDFTRDEVQTIDDTTQVHILVTPHQAVDKDGLEIKELYKVTIIIQSEENGSLQEQSFSTIHHPSLFTAR